MTHTVNTVKLILMTIHEGQLQILLNRTGEDHTWALPTGTVQPKETLEEAIERELKEATHVSRRVYFRQLYTFSRLEQESDSQIITTAYLGLTPNENIRSIAGKVQSAWADIFKSVVDHDDRQRTAVLNLKNDAVPFLMSYEMKDRAVDHYIETRSELQDTSNAQLSIDSIKAVNMAMDLVQHRAAETGILFNLLPEEATLREMQTAYEAILARKADTGNFRRDIRKMLIKTDHTRKIMGKNTALYRFNPLFQYLEENL